ncbi:zinc finger protein 280D-like isoform X1 [Portunus trituberculatus]|uniref:zinc finger protein 280D-like isoform X1 n=1 Tax=Portunus trituberculatus TaxID=210409 RepID=UPI001E1D1B1A|nr:zinc finger protein 280D-like isoform X1 [Portunus trituberculatus]XP_045128473.1 zinc finger protein 280D-like isoform X1 [Portunus trituberculatus]
MKTSIMDKIRILRSSRRKIDPKKGRTSGGAPVAVPAHPSQPAPAEATQQWVPVLVLNISKPNTPLATTTIPVTYSNNNTQNVTVKSSILAENDVPVTTCSSLVDVPVTNSNVIIQCNNSDSKQCVINPVEPAPGDVQTASTDTSEELQRTDQDASDNHVKCVLCDKIFPSLKDMQTHYLSTHKSRRGKDSRKTKVNSDSFATQISIDSEQCYLDQKSELSLPMSEKGEIDPKCPVCSIDFSSADEVNKHMREVHSYVCSECSSTFYTLFQFTNHKCTKIVKKVKRTKRKITASLASKLTLNPEAAKIMNSFVQIQPKTKNISKSSSRKSQRSPTPPSQEMVQQPVSMITLVGEAKQTQTLETPTNENMSVCSVTTSIASEVAEETSLSEPIIVSKQDNHEEEESVFFLPLKQHIH